MPPHRGHEFLVRFGERYARDLTVLVCTLDREPIPGRLRYAWMREMFPAVNVVHVTDDVPQEPSEHAEFWPIWRSLVKRYEPRPIDYVFASEDYGFRLADELGATYVPVDHARSVMPVSGTQIRADPLRHFDMLPECVRPYYVKRVCVFGPESTGKSTLAADLARHFNTLHAWEYARPLLDFNAGRCERDDIERIARGHMATEDALARRANRVLFSDTDPLTTTIWSEVLFGDCPQWIRDVAAARHYDLTLLLDVDVPWIDDDQRFFKEPAQRRAFFDRCKAALDAHRRRYVHITGTWDERFAAAVRSVEALIAPPSA